MNKQIITTSNTVESTGRDRRIAKSMVVAVSCEIVAIDLEKKGTYKVQSESDTNKYYIVKFMDGTPVYCSCKDFEIQSQKNRNHICKHQRAIVLAENYGLVQEVTKQQHRTNFYNKSSQRWVQNSYNNDTEDSSTSNNDDGEDDVNSRSYCQSQNNAAKFEDARIPKSSYKDDDYSF